MQISFFRKIDLSFTYKMLAAILETLYSVVVYPIEFVFWLPYYIPSLSMPLYLAGLFSIFGYLLVIAIQNYVCEMVPVNLKKKYDVKWAIVTGGRQTVERRRRRYRPQPTSRFLVQSKCLHSFPV